MIRSEGRRNYAVYNDILFLRDYGVQPLALHGLYGRDHVFAWHCHDAVTLTDCGGVLVRQGSGRLTRSSQDDMIGGHLDVAATSSGDMCEERIISVGPMGHEHHIWVRSPSRGISSQHTVPNPNIWDKLCFSRFQIQGFRSSKACFQLWYNWTRWTFVGWRPEDCIVIRSCGTRSHLIGCNCSWPSATWCRRVFGRSPFGPYE